VGGKLSSFGEFVSRLDTFNSNFYVTEVRYSLQYLKLPSRITVVVISTMCPVCPLTTLGISIVRKTNAMHILYSVYYELTDGTCFEHNLLNFRRRCTNDNLGHCVRVMLHPCATKRHNTHEVDRLLFVQRLLKMRK
jgi:hypothetical protein